MNELEWFYDFLDNHLEKGGFDKMKESYTLAYWKYFHREGHFKVEESSNDGFSFVNEGVTVHLDYIPERYENYELYLNPKTEVKIRKSKFQDIDQEWKVEKYSLYNDLFQLYYEKFDTFYDGFLRFIDINYLHESYDSKVRITLNRLNRRKKKARDEKFYIKKDGENYALLFYYIHELSKKIIRDFSPNFVQVESVSQKNNEEDLEIEGNSPFNGGALKKIKSYFDILTSMKLGYDSNPVLSIEQVNLFLKKAFINLDSKGEKLKMNFTPKKTHELIIRYFFYNFYSFSIEKFGEKEKGRKRAYVKLLSDNFEGFDEDELSGNFEKRPSTNSIDKPKLEEIISTFEYRKDREY